jgi:hypothetical protein
MTDKFRNTAAVGLAAAGLLTAAPAAAATTRLDTREAKFKVSVEGVQTTTWTANHEPQFRCDRPFTGSGKETVNFKSKRAVVIRAFQLGNGTPMLLNRSRRGLATLPTKGWVNRNGSTSSPPVEPDCAVGDGDGDGTYTPPAPDCGRKSFGALDLELMYDPLKRGRLTLSGNGPRDPQLFKQCPVHGTSWPSILSSDDRKRTAGEELPYKDLFDKRQGKTILIGRGTQRQSVYGITSTSKIRWELTLRRLRGK